VTDGPSPVDRPGAGTTPEVAPAPGLSRRGPGHARRRPAWPGSRVACPRRSGCRAVTCVRRTAVCARRRRPSHPRPPRPLEVPSPTRPDHPAGRTPSSALLEISGVVVGEVVRDAGEGLLDAEEVVRHPQPRPLRVARGERAPDRLVLSVRAFLCALLVEAAPQALADGAAGERLDERGEDGVAGVGGADAVERDVGLDGALVGDGGLAQDVVDLVEDGARLGEGLGGDAGRGDAGGLGLEDAAHVVEGEGTAVSLEVDDEAHGGQQAPGVEARDVGAVALAGVDDPEDGQRAHAFAQGAARDAESLGEVLLDGEAVAGTELSVEDHALDAVDDLIRAGHTRSMTYRHAAAGDSSDDCAVTR